MECTDDKGAKGFKYGDSGKCYIHDGSEAGMKAAKEKAVAQGLAMGDGKLEDAAELTREYLLAFYNMVKVHPNVFKHVLDEVHLSARGQAGGKIRWSKMPPDQAAALIDPNDSSNTLEGLEKLSNAAEISGDYIETEEYIDAPTVFAREGVFIGTNGRPMKKDYTVLKANAPRFLGASITEKHLNTDTLRPGDRWLGHAISVVPRDDKRDIWGYTRYYKQYLNQDELEKIRNKQYPDGSIGYFTDIKDEVGEFNGKKYDAVEIGPYTITEYANFFDGTKGACSRADGCGPFQNAAGSLVLVDGELVKRDSRRCKKMVDDTKFAELEKQHNAALEEIKTLKADIEKMKNSAPDLKPLTDKLAELEASNKQLNEKFVNKETSEAVAKDTAAFGEFKKLFNAGHASEAEALWPTVKAMNPVEYEAWKVSNSSKLLNQAPAGGLRGNRLANSGATDKVAEARKAALAAYEKR